MRAYFILCSDSNISMLCPYYKTSGSDLKRMKGAVVFKDRTEKYTISFQRVGKDAGVGLFEIDLDDDCISQYSLTFND